MSSPQMNILSPTLCGQSTGRTSYYSGLEFRTFACYARPGMDNETCQVTCDACSNGSSPAVTVPTVDDSNDVREERTTKKGRQKDRRERTTKTGDTASRTVCTLGNPPTN